LELLLIGVNELQTGGIREEDVVEKINKQLIISTPLFKIESN